MNDSFILRKVSETETKEIVFFLMKLAVAGLLVSAVFVAPGIGILTQYFPGADRKDRQRIKRALRYMDAHGFVNYDRNQLESAVVTTKDGDVFMNENLLFDITYEKPREWDEKWFVVMFDIPNRKGDKVRHLLRNKLLDIGFISYQDSVYVFPYECRAMIRDVQKILGIQNCVQTMVVSEIDGENSLKRYFNLP